KGRNNNGVAQERRAETSRNDVGAARRRHCIRITFSRLKATGKWNSGPTSEPPSRPPEPLLNNKPNPVSPAACWTRKYVPDPARSTPLRFTALPAPTPGTSVKAAGIARYGGTPVPGSGHLLRSSGESARDRRILYASSAGGVQPGR